MQTNLMDKLTVEDDDLIHRFKSQRISLIVGRTETLTLYLLNSAAFMILGLLVGKYLYSSRTAFTTLGIPSEISASHLERSTTKVFELNATFTEAPSPETNTAWRSLIPLGRGFIAIDNNGKPSKYRGHDTDMSDIRGLSIFHQIHCLNELRIGYYSAQAVMGTAGSTDRYGPPSRDIQGHQRHHHSPSHMKHCFDYLRQGIMCAADLSLEELDVAGEGEIVGVRGWGAQHQCADYAGVMEWAEVHRATGDGGIQ